MNLSKYDLHQLKLLDRVRRWTREEGKGLISSQYQNDFFIHERLFLDPRDNFEYLVMSFGLCRIPSLF